MASLVLGVVGTSLGASMGGTVLGLSAATVGGMVGSAVGSVVDSMIVASMMPDQRVEGQRLESLQVTTSTEGAVIPRVFGRMRVGGNIIWATDFREEVSTKTQGGGKGGGPTVTTTTYQYYASFALALCEGPITGIGRIWADGEPMDLENVTYRFYLGTETQGPDSFITSKMGADATPAYRGTAYLVFEELALEPYGNRIPQISVEVFNALDDEDVAEGQIRAVTMIPSTGEYAYATEKVTKDAGDGETQSENVNASGTQADFLASLDQLEASVPGIESVSLVVSWFGDDLRAGECLIKPGVEVASKDASATWSVNGVSRADAYLISTDGEGRPVYGGTPADFSIVQAIQEIKARGLRVTFYPFILMDIPAGNSLPDPYSDNAGDTGQPAFPWRGRITCSPAAGYAGTVDKTATAASQVADFFGTAAPGDFTVDGETVAWSGGTDWGYRRMILHYAHLCAAAGGVDTFLIGSELRGLTRIRESASSYPAVVELVDLAEDVSGILGSGTAVSYAADWSEYFGHQPGDGSGDVYFHLDPLWSSFYVDFVGIDNYMPLSDWRDGFDHLDAQSWASIYEIGYLQSNIEGGEGYDWYYASAADREAQTRAAISDGAEGKDWVFRYKDIRAWWSNQHYDRPGGVESATPTGWTAESKPIRFTELGCPAIDRGANRPNVFYDPKSSESAVPYFSRGWRDDAMQRAFIEAVLGYWGDTSNNPESSVYAAPMVDMAELAIWTWDARPYPAFPSLSDVWADGDNWRYGHWLTGRAGSASVRALVRALCERAGMAASEFDADGLHGAVEGYTITSLESARASISVIAAHFGFDATESLGKIIFRSRGRAPAATITIDDLLAGEDGEPLSLERAQETELPQALKWTVLRSDEEYNQAAAEDRRRVVASSRIVSESFPLAVPPEEAFRRVRRSLMERWAGRETASFALPPSRMALDPTDVVTLLHDGRGYDLRLQTVADNEGRSVTAVLQDRLAYDLPPGPLEPARISRPTVLGAAMTELFDLPQLTDEDSEYRPLVAAYAKPWPGEVAVYRSLEESGFSLLTSFSTPAQMGVTASTLESAAIGHWDLKNELLVDVASGTLESVSDLALFGGANAFAVETGAGAWEILQAGTITLVSPGRYKLTRLLRGQRGTEWAIAESLAAGARVVVLDEALVRLPIERADIGTEWNWRVGPANLASTDPAYVAETFTPPGEGLKCFRPCHLRLSGSAGSDDLVVSWTRQDRAPQAGSWGIATPMSEDSESYEVEILSLDGSTVLRTVTGLSEPQMTYAAADQTADYGGTVSQIRARVYQVGALGRGRPLEDTVSVSEVTP